MTTANIQLYNVLYIQPSLERFSVQQRRVIAEGNGLVGVIFYNGHYGNSAVCPECGGEVWSWLPMMNSFVSSSPPHPQRRVDERIPWHLGAFYQFVPRVLNVEASGLVYSHKSSRSRVRLKRSTLSVLSGVSAIKGCVIQDKTVGWEDTWSDLVRSVEILPTCNLNHNETMLIKKCKEGNIISNIFVQRVSTILYGIETVDLHPRFV